MRYKIQILSGLISIVLFACNGAYETKKDLKRPNILLLVADDMGYADLDCYGGISNTPNLNKLAENGLLFTDFYAAAPNCSPSRAGLLTGKSPANIGMYNYRPTNHPMHLLDREETIAEVLQNQGYDTSHFGKWHLGCLPQDPTLNHPQPSDQGFSYSFGTESNAKPSHLNPVNFVRNGVKLDKQEGYSCQILTTEAITWFDNYHEAENPFFMYVAFHEPHVKVASPSELVQKYAGFPKKYAEYLANIENLDLAVGRIIDYLSEKQLLENTLIIFSSDNGSYRQASNGKLRAEKGSTYEGGIRVPGIIHWPALIKKQSVINEPAGFVDIMPTICDILKVQPFEEEELDGTSILSLLKGGKFERKNPLYWYFYRTSPEIAMRVGDVMILGKDNDTIPRTHRFSAPDMAYIKNMNLVDYELYDLSKDIGQTENIINEHPKTELYKNLIDDKLKDIQLKGYNWEELPEAIWPKKVKTEWRVKY